MFKILLLLTIGYIASSTVALAALGGSADTVESDRMAMKSPVVRSETSPKFTMHELNVGGTAIREYESGGVIFAVAWSGLAHPDLSTLLGGYYAAYKTKISTVQQSAKGSRYHSISTGNLVLEKDGHMRNVFGRAYDLTLFPTGVTLSDIN